MTPPASGAPQSKEGPAVAMPWVLVTLAVSGACMAVATFWVFVPPMWGWEGLPIATRAILAVLPVSLLGWFVTIPWVPRSIIRWTSAWLAGTVARLLLTPAAIAAVYFSAPCDAAQLVAATGACYFAALMAEVGTVATRLLRHDSQAR